MPNCSNLGPGKIVCKPGNYSEFVLARGVVSDNNSTKEIDLSGCKISDVDYESFHRLPALTHLNLSQNLITRLKLGVLDGFKNLIHLDLSHNQLKTFPLGLFDQKPNLVYLDLSHNQLQALELGIFDPLSKLRFLDLSNNSLRGADIDPYIFDKSKRIKTLSFSTNDMSGAQDILLHAMTVLEKLDLEDCQLEELPAFALKSNMGTLKELNLSQNKLQEIRGDETFKHLTGLVSLNLTSNTIEMIGEAVFKPLNKLKVIALRDNRIKQLPETVFQNMPLSNIDLSRNLIEFIPVNAFRGTKTKNLNLSSNRFTYLQDNFCLELRNSGAFVNKFYFNDNPWQCACLRQLLNEVRRFDIVYNNAKFDGQHPVCVEVDGPICHRHVEFNEHVYEIYDN
ncbi:unnamed protein product [Leptosia nina]|uniref:Uncharacterized protein n=1 Tax=Leptosia nina TaxID=320188 RepID=A0AAV1IX91_9NEOP